MIKNSSLEFVSPTHGEMSFETVMERVIEFVEQEPGESYGLIIGSDSQGINVNTADFVSAIVVHRVGYGGIFFWRRFKKQKVYGLRDRIYREATASLELAEIVISGLKNTRFKNGSVIKEKDVFPDLEIHVDIGRKGDTRELISEVIGMIRGAGYIAKMKPEAIGASKVADRYT